MPITSEDILTRKGRITKKGYGILSTLSTKGGRILKHIEQELLREHKGKFVAIEVDSREYFIGDSMIAAIDKARAKYPDKVFHVAMVGWRAKRVPGHGHPIFMLRKEQ